jgi:hypothetical protein
VRDAGGHVAEGDEALLLAQLLLEATLDGAVAQHQHDAAAAAVVLDQRRGGDVHQGVAGETPVHGPLGLDARAARGQHALRQGGERRIFCGDALESRADRGLGRRLEDPAGLGVQQLHPALGVEDRDAIEHGVEHAVQVSRRMAHAAGSSPPKKSRTWCSMCRSSSASSTARRKAALPGRPFE